MVLNLFTAIDFDGQLNEKFTLEANVFNYSTKCYVKQSMKIIVSQQQ